MLQMLLAKRTFMKKEMENTSLIFICSAALPRLVTACLGGHGVLKMSLCMLEILREKRKCPQIELSAIHIQEKIICQ